MIVAMAFIRVSRSSQPSGLLRRTFASPMSGVLWTAWALLCPHRCNAGREWCGATSCPSMRRPRRTISMAPCDPIVPSALPIARQMCADASAHAGSTTNSKT